MFVHNINPVLFSLGPLEVRYYGILYALGFILTYFFLKQVAKQTRVGLKDEGVDTLLLYLILGTVIGARVFEILFYNPSYYFSSPLKMFALWEGGLSFHGGLVGTFITTYLFCRKKKITFLKIADIISIPAALALAIGRIGNFINGELYGRITSVPWGVKFPHAEGVRHPSQLYEAAKNFLIFFILWKSKDKEHKPGYLFGLFLAFYGLLRFLVEFVREPEVMVSFLTMGQILSIPVFLIGLWLVIKKK